MQRIRACALQMYRIRLSVCVYVVYVVGICMRVYVRLSLIVWVIECCSRLASYYSGSSSSSNGSINRSLAGGVANGSHTHVCVCARMCVRDVTIGMGQCITFACTAARETPTSCLSMFVYYIVMCRIVPSSRCGEGTRRVNVTPYTATAADDGIDGNEADLGWGTSEIGVIPMTINLVLTRVHWPTDCLRRTSRDLVVWTYIY